MKIAADHLPYLRGEKYSSSLKVTFDMDEGDFAYSTRAQMLSDMCRGKELLHVGFVDHTQQTIDDKKNRDKWLHEVLCRVAKRCYGLDIDKAGVDYVKKLGYADVECINILREDSKEVFSQTWDYLLIPDVLEHQDNPVEFLAGFGNRFRGVAGQMVITVPNAFSKNNFKVASRNTEVINSDHRYWFTPYTLVKVIMAAGLHVNEIRTCRSGVIKPWTVVKNAYFSKRPLIRNSLVAIVDF